MPRKKKSIVDSDGNYIKLIKESPKFDNPPKGNAVSICEETVKRIVFKG